jgi:predicted acetyltransferase
VFLHYMPAIVHLYNQCNAMRSGSIVRSPDRFKEFLQGSDWGTEIISYLWENNEGKLLAYAVMDKDSTAVRVNEIEAVDDSLFATALYFFVMQAVEKRCESIHMKLPVDHPFVEFTQRYGAEWVVTFERYGNGMMRIINQQALFGALIPELERRLAITNFHNYTGTLTLETDLGTMHLIIEGGTVRLEEKGLERIKLSLSQQYLIQLLIGYRSVRDVVNDPAVQIRGDAIPLLNALFPKGTPYMYFADHF